MDLHHIIIKYNKLYHTYIDLLNKKLKYLLLLLLSFSF